MAITATSAVRDRIVDLLEAMTVVDGTKKAVMTRIRSNAQDWEGYIFRVRLRASTNSLFDLSTRLVTEQWLIEIYSPRTGLGNEALKEDELYAYRDKVADTFLLYQTLQGLSTVQSALLTGEAITWQSDTSLDDSPRSKWAFTLEVNRMEVC